VGEDIVLNFNSKHCVTRKHSQIALRRLQESELSIDAQQEKNQGETAAQEILLEVQKAYAA